MVGRRRQSAKNAKGKAPEVPAEPEIEEETYFLNPDAVSPHLYCCICQEVFKEPWRAPCGHSFCKRCIFDWLQKNAICPSDRKPVTVGQLHHDFLVQNIIDDYIVACPWRALGCNNVGPLHQLKEHKKICPLNPNTMPKVLQDYSVQMLSSAQEELQRKQVQRTMAAVATSRQSAPSVLPSRQSSGGGACVSSSSGASSSLFEQLLSEELQRDNDDAKEDNGESSEAATTTAVANAASTVPKSDTAAAGPDDSSFDDDDANLPGGQLPSLRMRLYVNSQAEGRNEYVNFLENLTTRPQLLQVPESISRYCCEQSQPPDSKRPRLGDD
ncbi:hypothetical protein BOX15_Mlig020381g7 [Macrostomum lignano]|uniref:RING-type domain-containing protein n=1 Tax=Macrostomum lignano TaxID=282301 RepID=A0A267E5B9_9PLAT|nr:hypothetical protein BOX15_Mlig020381g7 [Macrostomum lignano]